MVEMNLTEQDKIILDYILFNEKGIDRETLFFELNLYFGIRDFSIIENCLVNLKMKKLMSTNMYYFQNDFRNNKPTVIYKGVK